MKWILILIGSALILDTLYIMQISNMNLGVVLPAILGTPLLLFGIFYSSLVKIKWIVWLMAAGYSAYILLLVVTTIIMLSAASVVPPANADALIVLGAGVRGENITLTLKYRLDTAIGYLNENPDTVCVATGGQGRGEDISEALAAKRYLLDKGISEDRIIMEQKSTSTEENLKYAKELLDVYFDKDYSTVVVTTDFHIYRAMINVKKAGYTDAHSLRANSGWYTAFNNYLRESLAILHVWVFG